MDTAQPRGRALCYFLCLCVCFGARGGERSSASGGVCVCVNLECESMCVENQLSVCAFVNSSVNVAVACSFVFSSAM